MHRFGILAAMTLGACGGDDTAGGAPAPDGGTTTNPDGSSNDPDGSSSPDADGSTTKPDGATGSSPVLSGCSVFPSNHIFNTPIDSLPVHPSNSAFMTTIGVHNLHLDLGTQTNQQAVDFYGIPWNVVKASSIPWLGATYYSADTNLSWMPRDESDCGSGSAHTLVSPCLASTAPSPVFPIPAMPIVEGGIDTNPTQPYGDHHMLLLDTDSCRLWELYHSYPDGKGGWDIFGSATWDLGSNALRTADWSSADAAGFPILPLLLKVDEANSGAIKHALRFTILSSRIRAEYVWPARHLTGSDTSKSLPPMGQLFRLKASFSIPSTFNTQSKAILQAMKTYGMYIADGGSNMYVTGEPNAGWLDPTFTQVQSVSSSDFEAVDVSPILARAGFDPNSAAVPP